MNPMDYITEFKIPLFFIAIGILCIVFSINIFINISTTENYTLKLYSGIITGLGALLFTLVTFVFDKGGSVRGKETLSYVKNTKLAVDTIDNKADTTITKITDLQNENIDLKSKVLRFQDEQIAKNKEMIGLTQRISDLSETNLNLNLSQSKVIDKIKNPLPEEIKIDFSCSFKLDKAVSGKFRDRYRTLYPNILMNNQFSAFNFEQFNDILEAHFMFNYMTLSFVGDISTEESKYKYSELVCLYNNRDKFYKGLKLENVSTLYNNNSDEIGIFYKDVTLQRERKVFETESSGENFGDNSLFELENTTMVLIINNLVGSENVKTHFFTLKSKELNLTFYELTSSLNSSVFTKKINITNNK
jgi:hypothetical protein